MKRILGVLLSATMILVMAAGCKDQRAENASGKSGQEIIVGTNSESGGLDPAGMIADTSAVGMGGKQRCLDTVCQFPEAPLRQMGDIQINAMSRKILRQLFSCRFEPCFLVGNRTAAIHGIMVPGQRDNAHACLQCGLDIFFTLQQFCAFHRQKCCCFAPLLCLLPVFRCPAKYQFFAAVCKSLLCRLQEMGEPCMGILRRCHRFGAAEQGKYLCVMVIHRSPLQIHMPAVAAQGFPRPAIQSVIAQFINGITMQVEIFQSNHLKCIGNMTDAAGRPVRRNQNFHDIKPGL